LVREDGVLAGDGDVVEEDPAVGRAADRRLVGLGAERLPRPAAARANDERRTFDGEVLEDRVRRAVAVVWREGLSRLRSGLVLDEQRPAAGAVIRRLRILEAALLAVDMGHVFALPCQASAWLGRAQLGGAALEVRISVRRSTSSWSRTLRPSVFCSRATSSARRMSIFPCRRRRWYEISSSCCVRSSISCLRSSSESVPRSGRGSTRTAFRREGSISLKQACPQR